MKVVKEYCSRCRKETKHTKSKFMEGFARGYFAIFTFGFSELANTAYYECIKCGKKTEKEMI